MTTIDIVHRLRDTHLVGYKEGWQDVGGRGFITRIWPTNKLTKLFEGAAFGEYYLKKLQQDKITQCN